MRIQDYCTNILCDSFVILIIHMNKIKSIYATEISEQLHNPLKDSFKRFTGKMDEHIRKAVILRKNELIKQSEEYAKQISKVTDQSNRCKKKIFEQQKEFELKIESKIQTDIGKWSDYQLFFKANFEELEERIKEHRTRNNEHRRRIEEKREEVKRKMREEKKHESNIASLIQLKKIKDDNLTTKESSIQLSYSHSLRNRIRTESSLPSLKPSQRYDRYDRIKTIQSDYDEQEERKPQSKKALSYMQPIGTVRGTQQSSLPLLIDLLGWYKQKERGNDNWFLKVIFNQRNYNRLMDYLETNSKSRKIIVKR